MARNCRFPDLETYGSQPGNQRLPLQGIAGSQKLGFMFSKLSGFHCKELPNANIPVPVHSAKQGVLYRSIQQNHKIVKKLFSYHFDMRLFRAKTFLCRPNSQTQTFRYRSIAKQKVLVEKAPCTDLRSDPTLHPRFLQNYAGGRVRQPRTPNTSAERKFPN